MDMKSWPWKKKSSDKKAVATVSNSSVNVSDTNVAQVDQVKQDKPKYVQISLESYMHLTELENRVKSYEEQVQDLEDKVNELNEKLSEADLEMTNKDNLVKQHAKVAEEAVSGWEKADAEAVALKNHLESVTLLKLTAEDRAAHLDGALKECMWQIRNLKEEHDKKLDEVVLNKTKIFDKMKKELEAKIANLDEELMKSAADNAALSRSLQERSNVLIHLSEAKSQTEAEIECLKGNIESCEKEINSLKYEVHIAKKEVEIRSEEKNMSVRSAEVANKQHLEAVKKNAKLEAECQRLRGLVRKKLPGPAALAQMKLEVENLGRDYGEPHVRRSLVKSPTSHSSQFPEFSLEDAQKYIKENELLTERLLAMEEETKMLKEALAKRNGELQDSRSVYAQAASKLQTLETQLQLSAEKKSPMKSYTQDCTEGLCSKASNGSSCASMSEDGNDDNSSCTVSFSTGLMPELSQFKKEKNVDSPHKLENSKHLDLMDDFLEMEKLACQSDRSNGAISESEKKHALVPQMSPKEGESMSNPQLHLDAYDLVRLQSKVSMILDSISNEKDIEKLVENIKSVLQEVRDAKHPHSVNGAVDMDRGSGATNEIVEMAVSQIYNFIMILGKEAKAILETSPDGDGLNKNVGIFSAKYSDAMNRDIDLIDFILNVSRVLTTASELHFSVLGFKSSEVEISSSDCIDKVALPENKDVVNRGYPNGCAHFSDSASDPDVSIDGNLVPTSEKTASPRNCSLGEFEELKRDKDNLADDLARCRENFESTKAQLLETEQLLTEVKSQLVLAQKSNSLAETQVKCMAESYKALESRAEDLQTEVNLLRGKVENLENELQEEKKHHQDAIDRFKDLQEQVDSIESNAAADIDMKTNQELAAAAEKLAECQETIYVLGKQLKALRPPNIRSQRLEAFLEDGPIVRDVNSHDIDSEAYTATTPHSQRIGIVSPSFDSEADTSPICSKKHRPTKSVSSSVSSTPTPEKHVRGISRFFASKSNYNL